MAINIFAAVGVLLFLPVVIAGLLTVIRRMRGKPSSFRPPAAVLLVASSVAFAVAVFLASGSSPPNPALGSLVPGNILLLLWVLVISPRQVARARRPSTH